MKSPQASAPPQPPAARMSDNPYTLTYVTHKFESIMERSPQMRYIFTMYALWLTLVCLPELLVGLYELRMHVLRQALTDLFHSTCPFVVMGAVLLQQKELERQQGNIKLTYGGGRIKVLAALTNCLFLLATSLFTFLETLHELTLNFDNETQRRTTQSEHAGLWIYMVPFGLMKLLLAGSFILIFRDRSVFAYLKQRLAAVDPHDLAQQPLPSHSPDSSSGSLPTSQDYLLHSFYLVCFIEMLENAAGLAGMMARRLAMFETSLSFIVALVNVVITVPLFYDLVHILLQGLPLAHRRPLQRLVEQAGYIQGVIEIAEHHFWTLDGDRIIGTVKARVRRPERGGTEELWRVREKLEQHFSGLHEVCVQTSFV